MGDRSGKVLLVALAAVMVSVLAAAGVVMYGPAGAAVVPGLAGLVVSLVHPVFALYALAAAIPLEETVIWGGATISKVLGLLVAVAWFANKFLTRGSLRRLMTSPVFGLAALLFGYAALSGLWADHTQGMQGALVRLAMFLALGIVAADVVRDWSAILNVSRALVLGGMGAALITLSQYATGAVHRAGGGVAGDINATAGLLIMIVPLAFLLFRAGGATWRLISVAFVALAIGAVGVTFSRMAYLLLPLVLGVEAGYLLRSRRGRFAVLLAAIVAVPIVYRFVPTDTVQERIQTVKPYVERTLGPNDMGLQMASERGFHILVALEIFRDHPIFGAGLNNYGVEFLQYQYQVMGSQRLYDTPRSAHSTYFAILADLGLIGIAILVALLVAVARSGLKAWRTASAGGEYLAASCVRALMIAFTVLVVYGFYAEIHKEKFFWLIVGMIVAATAMVMDGAAVHRPSTRVRGLAMTPENSSIVAAAERPGGLRVSTGR